jgi:hypothetical protein
MNERITKRLEHLREAAYLCTLATDTLVTDHMLGDVQAIAQSIRELIDEEWRAARETSFTQPRTQQPSTLEDLI